MLHPKFTSVGFFCIGLIIFSLFISPFCHAAGPLCVSKVNSRYFTDDTSKAIYLTGSHTWNNLVDIGPSDPPPKFDYTKFLDYLESRNHNFFRLWTWDLVKWDTTNNSLGKKTVHTVAPHKWLRTGPGLALDGKPKFNLEKFNPEYFKRLGKRVKAAQKRGMYAAVMLFEGWGMQFCPDAWQWHPFNPKNNINGVDGDLNGDGRGFEVYTLADPALTAIQEAYVRKVIDTINEFDNVLYEISNENHPPSLHWQYHMIDFIHDYEAQKPKQHPVGMTFQYRGGTNRDLFKSPAEWISPHSPKGGYKDDPPANDGKKVIILDTDHLGGIAGNRYWVWKSFLRGMNPIFMDPYDEGVLGLNPFNPKWDRLRRALGHTRTYAEKIDLINMVPSNDMSSTGYCLAAVPTEYLVYQPVSNGNFTIKVIQGIYKYEWFSVEQEKVVETGEFDFRNIKVTRQTFRPPVSGDIVLYLKLCSPTADK